MDPLAPVADAVKAGRQPIDVTIVDHTSQQLTPTQLFDLVWSNWYQLMFQFNRSPWVERGVIAPVRSVRLIEPTDVPDPSANVYHIELLDDCEEPGAIGFHEDEVHASSAHSRRGLAAETLKPLAKIGVKTARAYKVSPSAVVSHEALESLCDPNVVNDADLRKYVDPATGDTWIGEVCDPVQGRDYPVGAPEQRGSSDSESVVSDFVYPSFFGQAQGRPQTSFCEEVALAPRIEPFTVGPEGYASIQKAGSTEWEQVLGADKVAAEAKEHAFEGGEKEGGESVPTEPTTDKPAADGGEGDGGAGAEPAVGTEAEPGS